MTDEQTKQLRQLLLNLQDMAQTAKTYEAYYYAIMALGCQRIVERLLSDFETAA